MARAYAYANGDGPLPNELYISRLVQKYGADSVYGRPLGAKDIRRLEMTEQIVNLYQIKNAQANQADWANNNQLENNLLMYALKCAVNLGLIDGK